MKANVVKVFLYIVLFITRYKRRLVPHFSSYKSEQCRRIEVSRIFAIDYKIARMHTNAVGLKCRGIFFFMHVYLVMKYTQLHIRFPDNLLAEMALARA